MVVHIEPRVNRQRGGRDLGDSAVEEAEPRIVRDPADTVAGAMLDRLQAVNLEAARAVRDRTRKVRALRGEVAEARPEPVSRRRDPCVA